MEATLFEILFKDGRKYRVFCYGKNQKKRLKIALHSINDKIESVTELSNGIHKIEQFEKIVKNLD